MKKEKVIFLGFLMSMTLIASSCGSSKNASTATTDDNNIELKDADNCETLAAEPTKNVRAFGIGLSPNRMAAYDMALEKGRVNLAKALETKVKSEFKDASSTEDSEVETGSDLSFEEKTLTIIHNTCLNAVSNAKIICSKTYKKKDRNVYETHVCMELSSTLKNEVKQQINNLLEK